MSGCAAQEPLAEEADHGLAGAVEMDSLPDEKLGAPAAAAADGVSEPRGVHAAGAQFQPAADASAFVPVGRWGWVEEYFPWGSRERMLLDLWREHFALSDEGFGWLIRLLRDPAFRTSHIWRSFDDFQKEQAKFPRTPVTERKCASVHRSNGGLAHSTLAEISLIATLQMLIADPP